MYLVYKTFSPPPIGTSWLSKGFLKGAEATGKAIHKGASKLREHITPENTPAEVNPRVTRGLHVAKQATGGAVRVSQFLGKHRGLGGGCYLDNYDYWHITFCISRSCVFLLVLFIHMWVCLIISFSECFLISCVCVCVCVLAVNGVCTVAGCVGDKLAPHVKKHGAKLIPDSMKTQDGRSNLDGAMIVAASSMQGASPA